MHPQPLTDILGPQTAALQAQRIARDTQAQTKTAIIKSPLPPEEG